MTSTTPPTKASRPKSPRKAQTTLPVAAKALPALDRSHVAPRDPNRVVLAAIVGAHGIGGEVRLKLFTDDLAAYRRFNDGALTLVSARAGGNGTIARFAEIGDRTAAEALRGTQLTVARAELPPLGEGEYYHADLIGLPVISTEGVALGRVVTVENFGAGDVIEIERPGAARFMVPMHPEAVPEWDAARLVVSTAFAG